MGSGGGSSGSGVVRYAPYLEATHEDYISKTAAVPITRSINEVMNSLFSFSALGDGNPYNDATNSCYLAYNPNAPIAEYMTAILIFRNILNGIDEAGEWDLLYSQAVSTIDIDEVNVLSNISVTDAIVADTAVADALNATPVPLIDPADIDNDADALGDLLDDEILTKIMPRIEAGMRDINAVVASAFPIARSIVEGMRNRDVAKHASGLRAQALFKNAEIGIENERIATNIKEINLSKNVNIASVNMSKNSAIASANLTKDIEVGKVNSDLQFKHESLVQAREQFLVQARSNAAQLMTQFLIQKYAWEEAYVRTYVESQRIKIVAQKEAHDVNMDIDLKRTLWDVSVFSHGANMMAAISGAAVVPEHTGPSKMQSAIGGGLMGAGSGAMIGAQVGTAGGPLTAGAGALIGGVIGFASAFL